MKILSKLFHKRTIPIAADGWKAAKITGPQLDTLETYIKGVKDGDEIDYWADFWLENIARYYNHPADKDKAGALELIEVARNGLRG